MAVANSIYVYTYQSDFWRWIDKLNFSSVSQKPAVDTVDLSGSLPTATLADFTKKPPIDVESVSKIKEAIANGEYPIDLDAVADMLLDAYKEMKS